MIRDIFGCDEFPGKVSYTLDFLRAAERITYTAANYVRGPVGNIISNVGNIDAILRPKYVENMMLMTPGDSWHYEAQFPHCLQWDGCHVGTIASPFHTLYAWMTGGGPTNLKPVPTPATCATQMSWLRYAVCGLGPTRDHPVGAATIPSSYFEVDPLGMINYPEGVKIITASFAAYFGTYFGDLMRRWCQHWGWALAWTLHDAAKPLDARRLLDPQVLANSTVNASVSAATLAKFEAMYVAANASRATPVNFTDYATVWAEFVNTTNTPDAGNILTWNIGVRHCENYNDCFGLADSTGTCVCYVNRTD